jgi:hypothetical protein
MISFPAFTFTFRVAVGWEKAIGEKRIIPTDIMKSLIRIKNLFI